LLTLVEIFLSKYSKQLYDSFEIYLPLITVNSLILQRLVFASKNKVKETIKDSLKNGFIFLILISIIGLLREILGSGTITIMNNVSSITGYRWIIKVFTNSNKLFLSSGGAFILLGILVGMLNALGGGNNEVN